MASSAPAYTPADQMPGSSAPAPGFVADPSAPPLPLDKMDVIAGYETFIAGQAPPPPPYESVAPPAPIDPSRFSSAAAITSEQAKHSLLLEVDAHCCWGKKAAQELSVTKIESHNATHYVLESYGEKRTTEWRSEPYVGQLIDGPMNGRAPTPWEIDVRPPPPFTERSLDMEVPHTASVKPCFHCYGRGKRDCTFCNHGRKDCHMCNAQNRAQCSFCGGRGWQSCMTCHGHGHIDCLSCRGTGSLKCYIVLRIRYKVHTGDFVQENIRTPLPNSLIRKAGGVVIFQDEALRVWPLTNYPDPSVNDASQRLINEHASKIASTERVLIQRHRVRSIPVNQCSYTYRNKTGLFFVYGTENHVHAPDYPQQCCCGCSVL